jgi:hypothetical protein
LRFPQQSQGRRRVELPKSFRKAYPRIVRLHVTNHLWNRQRCLLLLTAGQRHEFFTRLASLPRSDHDAELLKLFFIGGCEAVDIIGSEFSIAKPLLNFLGAYRGQPDNATLCWFPPTPATSTAKTKRRRMLVPA